MKVEPAAADLIAIAREAILAEIAPSLPEAKRYVALMAANALAIAARDLAPPADGAEAARLASLLGERETADTPESLREATAALAGRIREGRFDEGEARSRLLAHLSAVTRARLAVSNPKALSRDDRKTP
jgi:hypothetical protein